LCTHLSEYYFYFTIHYFFFATIQFLQFSKINWCVISNFLWIKYLFCFAILLFLDFILKSILTTKITELFYVIFIKFLIGLYVIIYLFIEFISHIFKILLENVAVIFQCLGTVFYLFKNIKFTIFLCVIVFWVHLLIFISNSFYFSNFDSHSLKFSSFNST
jgi:hypothetical protein